MAEFPALPLFTDALLADTEHLTNEEFGAYIRLLVLIWRNANCRIPAKEEWIMRRLRANSSEYNKLYKPLVKEFLTSDGNYITQKRLRKEFEYLRRQRQSQSDNANKRWNNNKSSSRGNAPHPTPPQHDKAVDFKKVIFDEGLRWLSEQAKRTPTSMRSILARWCKLYGDAAVAAALVRGQKFSPVEPISFIEKFLKDGEYEKAGKSNGTLARTDKVDELHAAARRAAEAGGFASGPTEQSEVGANVSPELPGFENIRKKPKGN